MPRVTITLDNGGGAFDTQIVEYEAGDDESENASIAIQGIIEDWILSPGDTIKISDVHP